jgi:hypothetical protein
MLKSQIRRTIELKRALEEKEAVLQEQKRAIETLSAHMKSCPFAQMPTPLKQFVRKAGLGRFCATLGRIFRREDVLL